MYAKSWVGGILVRTDHARFLERRTCSSTISYRCRHVHVTCDLLLESQQGQLHSARSLFVCLISLPADSMRTHPFKPR